MPDPAAVFANLRRNLAALDPLAGDVTPAGIDTYLDYYRLPHAGQSPGCEYRIGWIRSAGERLAVQVWENPGARRNLLLVHGYFDHVGLFGHWVRFGLEQGYNVVAFDLPGHGLSTGPQGVIENFSRYGDALGDVLAALEALPAEWDVIAQSTGGAALLDALGRGLGDRFRRIVMFAPLLKPRGWWWIRLAHMALGGRKDSVRRGFGQNSHDMGFLEFVRQDPLQSDTISIAWIGALRRWLPGMLTRPPNPAPMLVLQGDEDRTVAWKYNLGQIQRLFPAARVHMIAEGRHHLANESEGIRREMRLVIAEYLKTPERN